MRIGKSTWHKEIQVLSLPELTSPLSRNIEFCFIISGRKKAYLFRVLLKDLMFLCVFDSGTYTGNVSSNSVNDLIFQLYRLGQ